LLGVVVNRRFRRYFFAVSRFVEMRSTFNRDLCLVINNQCFNEGKRGHAYPFFSLYDVCLVGKWHHLAAACGIDGEDANVLSDCHGCR